ncbi:LysR substrate-binding domain-containing protein [Novosphingobium rosa]|uniref:LysR substrate-binding domain-containing protein n=1 Tax=Novosphingobium rosa TaxID=76978 RepID=UPI00082A4C3E|nr:LysR substrate-binding domain-containing protein [Novosphingobium rosa]
MLDDLVTLKLFVRAAESGKLSEAANQSHLALAAASRRISLLEGRLRVKLFRRGRHGISLTPAGQSLLARAKTLLEQVRDIEGEMADFADGLRGTIRLQTNPSAIIQFLPADLAAFARVHPDVRIDLEENMSAGIVSALMSGQADIGIVVEGSSAALDQMEVMPYRSDRLALLAPLGRLQPQEEISFLDVADQDFVGLVSSTALTSRLIQESAKAERHLRLRMQVRSFDGVCRMVEAGFGFGVLPLIAAQGFAAAMALDVIPLSNDWAQRQMLIVLSPNTPLGSPSRNLLKFLGAFSDL